MPAKPLSVIVLKVSVQEVIYVMVPLRKLKLQHCLIRTSHKWSWLYQAKNYLITFQELFLKRQPNVEQSYDRNRVMYIWVNYSCYLMHVVWCHIPLFLINLTISINFKLALNFTFYFVWFIIPLRILDCSGKAKNNNRSS